MFFGIVIFNFSLSALNTYMYTSFGHHWWSLLAAIFCGAMGIYTLTQA